MTDLLLATEDGCRVFTESGEGPTELAGRAVGALAAEGEASCLAIVDGQELWRRDPGGAWVLVAPTGIFLQSVASIDGQIYAGGMDEPALLRVEPAGKVERLTSFEATPGRAEWFAGGPPLGVRSLAGTADNSVILAAVHVGGIPRSVDGARSWRPTIPVLLDVHEVRAHARLPRLVAAAASAGLCVSPDGGETWAVHAGPGPEVAVSLALAVLEDEVLFSLQDGPFAARSQVWRWRIGTDDRLEPVGDGLPEWLEGKVDTCQLAAGANRAALVDGGGNLWLSKTGSSGWERIATGLGYASGVAIL